MSRKLTPKQKQFVLEYLVDKNATQAAIRAGYSEKTAGSIGSENLLKPLIKLAIEVQLEEQQERTKITADKVLQELAHVAFARLSDFVVFDRNGMALKPSDQIDPDKLAAVCQIEIKHEHFTINADGETVPAPATVKLKMWSKTDALRDLGKHFGMFTDKMELSGSDGGPVEVIDLSKFTDKQLEAWIVRLQKEADK